MNGSSSRIYQGIECSKSNGVASIVVVKPANSILELTGVAFVGTYRALDVALVSIGTVDLLARHCATAQSGKHAVLGIGQIICGRDAVGRADQVTCDGVVIGLTSEGACLTFLLSTWIKST